MDAHPFRNKLLQHLDPETIQRLRLRPVKLEVGHEIENPGSSIDHLFFVEEGVGSMTTTFKDGSQVEVGFFGFEGVMGASGLMGTRRSLNRVYMQIAGNGFTSPMLQAKVEFKRCERFHDLVLRYVQAQLTQSTQSAGCNAKHNFEQRLAKWLLLCGERSDVQHFSIEQHFLASMLGSTRSTVSLTASTLKEAGLIDYTRGHFRIIDKAGLEARACECYRVVKDHLDNYIEFDTGFAI